MLAKTCAEAESMPECVILVETGSVAYVQVSYFSPRQRQEARERASMAKSADADAAVPAEVDMNQGVEGCRL